MEYPIMLVFFLAFYCLAFPISSLDTLQQGDFLNSSRQLVSANKLFVLGFYSPDPDPDPKNSPNVYLGIWYNSISNYDIRFPVWIGNRNTPIHNNSAVLSLDSFGNLFVKDNTSADSIKLYSSGQQTSINTTATLLGTGNFVVRETNSNGSVGQLLWQSFDYPTDTLLPEMKLGINHRTGLNWTLTSSFSATKPRNGAFSLEWDPTKLRLIVRRRGVISWSSGSLMDKDWDGFKGKGFEFFVPDGESVNYLFMSEKNEDEEYFYYKISKTSHIGYRNLVAGWLLNYQGTVYDPTNGNTIAVLDYCYGTVNKSSDQRFIEGCESWEQPKCRNIHQKFALRIGDFSKSGVEASGFLDRNSNFSISDCKDKCWRDCNCVGYRFHDPAGCVLWSGRNLKFEQDYSGFSLQQYVLISDASASKKRLKKLIPIVAAAMVSLATLMFGLLCYLKRKSRQGKEKELLELMTLDGYTETILLEKDGKNGQEVKFFSYSSIATATKNFSPENKLGEGGFGPVYKGKLSDGKEIAVKRLSKSSGQGLHEFKTELILIAKLQHTNLVRIFGCCIHGDEKMLVYEYMSNKSLDFFLFDIDETSVQQLTWERRFIIIEGIAQGLLYLHKYSRLRIVHRDLKASNILLDENMNPKISDFGTARIFKKNLCEENTNKITGTRGYMAPEYFMEGTFSDKSDVFSFGVLMLEIVSGRRNNSLYNAEGPLNLVAYAWKLWNRNSEIQLMDSALLGSSDIHDQVQRCIRVGLLCVQHSSTLRPTMSDVTYMLSTDNSALPVPNPPAFFQSPTNIEGNIDGINSEKFSVNGLTISEVGAR